MFKRLFEEIKMRENQDSVVVVLNAGLQLLVATTATTLRSVGAPSHPRHSILNTPASTSQPYRALPHHHKSKPYHTMTPPRGGYPLREHKLGNMFSFGHQRLARKFWPLYFDFKVIYNYHFHHLYSVIRAKKSFLTSTILVFLRYMHYIVKVSRSL